MNIIVKSIKGSGIFTITVDETQAEIRKEKDLDAFTTPQLLSIYNAASKVKVKRFADRTSAFRRVFIHLPALAGIAEAPDDAEPTKATKKGAKPKKAKAPKGERKPKEGLIFHFYAMARRASGVTMDEAVQALGKTFPDRKMDSMRATCHINTNPKYLPKGEKLEKEKDEKRGGIVYRLVAK